MRFDKALLVAGALLFVLGLLQGALVQSFLNPRMALSAHLTAVQSGTAIMVAGAVWRAVALGQLFTAIARWAIIAGMFGLWVGLTMSAMTGASQSLPIAGAGHSASAATETMVSAIVLGSSGLMTLGWVLVLVGFLRWKARGD